MAGVFVFLVAGMVFAVMSGGTAQASDGWYTEGDMEPSARIKIVLRNTLDFDRVNCPVAITRFQMPYKDLHEMRIVVVDPSLPPNPEPTKQDFTERGVQILRGETNGHSVFHQLDDLDKDGLWDELFFQTDIGANGTRTMYVYLGFSERGWNRHGTHANIGSYSHHLMPFWESEYMGWKLWYPTDCDLYGKREPSLVAYELYANNIDGYFVPYEHGTDIMTVEKHIRRRRYRAVRGTVIPRFRVTAEVHSGYG